MTLKNPDGEGLFETSDTSDDVTLTQIGDSMRTKGRRFMVLEIGTSGGSDIDFDQFEVHARIKQGTGKWHVLVDAWQGGNLSEVLLFSTADLKVLARGETEAAILAVGGWEEVRALSAQAGVTASPVTRNLKFRMGLHKGGN